MSSPGDLPAPRLQESARLVEDTVSKTADALAFGGSSPSLSATVPPQPLTEAQPRGSFTQRPEVECAI